MAGQTELGRSLDALLNRAHISSVQPRQNLTVSEAWTQACQMGSRAVRRATWTRDNSYLLARLDASIRYVHYGNVDAGNYVLDANDLSAQDWEPVSKEDVAPELA